MHCSAHNNDTLLREIRSTKQVRRSRATLMTRYHIGDILCCSASLCCGRIYKGRGDNLSRCSQAGRCVDIGAVHQELRTGMLTGRQ